MHTRRIVGVAVLAGALALTAGPAQAAPTDISPQRVAGSYASDGLHVFVRGTTNYLYEKVVTATGQQTPWKVLDTTPLSSSPASTVDSDGRVYVAARAQNGTVLYRWREPDGSWTGWKNVGGTTYGAPALQAVPDQGQQMASVVVAARDGAGRAQLRVFQPGSLTPPSPVYAQWIALDSQVLSAAPMLSAGKACPAPDDIMPPNVAYFQGRSTGGTGISRFFCAGRPDTWSPTVGTTASGVDADGRGRVWYRGTNGALWANDSEVGVPEDQLRIASTPSVAGYRVPVFEQPQTDPDSLLIRDNNGTSWLYAPAAGDGSGGTWTNLGGIAT
ncbi:hypothetical protein [Fodinicola acaciae]|uniref:hypothetical protein n=1 Tax=Fodinicola acaciae TaxID=2681555 RepID=UPI0013D3E3D0|nr:hypothetical protein [Fodinicola acaciae]